MVAHARFYCAQFFLPTFKWQNYMKLSSTHFFCIYLTVPIFATCFILHIKCFCLLPTFSYPHTISICMRALLFLCTCTIFRANKTHFIFPRTHAEFYFLLSPLHYSTIHFIFLYLHNFLSSATPARTLIIMLFLLFKFRSFKFTKARFIHNASMLGSHIYASMLVHIFN